jgi:hypothetical protein
VLGHRGLRGILEESWRGTIHLTTRRAPLLPKTNPVRASPPCSDPVSARSTRRTTRRCSTRRFPEKIWFYAIDRAKNEATFSALDSRFSTKIRLHPFLACLGVAPALEARSSITPAEHGGNMDATEASVGNTVYFPVNHRGALLYLGDGHAQQGDGEIAGTGIEVPMRRHERLAARPLDARLRCSDLLDPRERMGHPMVDSGTLVWVRYAHVETPGSSSPPTPAEATATDRTCGSTSFSGSPTSSASRSA